MPGFFKRLRELIDSRDAEVMLEDKDKSRELMTTLVRPLWELLENWR